MHGTVAGHHAKVEHPVELHHAIQLLIDATVTRLAAAWSCQVRWHRGPRCVP